METFTEHQLRTAFEGFGWDPETAERAMEAVRQAPKNEGALGHTDDELKGTARDAG